MGNQFEFLSAEETLHQLQSTSTGLTDDQAHKISRSSGPNMIKRKKLGFYRQYLKPTLNLMILILLFAAILKLIFGDDPSSPLLTIIVIGLNILLAMIQQFRVERTINALKRLSEYKAHILRNGKERVVDAREVVPGDVLILRQGDYVSADARVIKSTELMVNESTLTGESKATLKHNRALPKGHIPFYKQNNMVFASTFVASGTGKAVVTKIGLETQIGEISKGIALMEEQVIPLEKQVNRLAKLLGFFVLAIITLLFFITVIPDPTNIDQKLDWLIGLAVAAIPYNFPLIITIVLLTGVMRLARRNAIVRKISAIETMGRLTLICTDKTGTLTQNQMTATDIFMNGQLLKVTGTGYEGKGQIELECEEISPVQCKTLNLLLLNGILNNTSNLFREARKTRRDMHDTCHVIGMPTEGALLALAQKGGIYVQAERESVQVVKQFGFTSDRKRMSTIIRDGNSLVAHIKGAVELVLDRCELLFLDNSPAPLTQDRKNEILTAAQQMAGRGLRVLAFALKKIQSSEVTTLSASQVESKLIFLGLIGMYDPPRDDVAESIRRCRAAGVDVKMITGDHPDTAREIAREVGLYEEGQEIISGEQISQLSSEEILRVKIFARAVPQDKLRIMEAHQAAGDLVAMTGDGVNDALALERADVGIAMGLSGTDVAQEAADVVLTDDSFATIERAMFHGRGLFNNIRSTFMFLLVINLLELGLLTLIELIYDVKLFEIRQLFFLYFTIHFFPPFGLMFDKYQKDIMEEPPTKPNEPIINRRYLFLLIFQILSLGTVLIILWNTILSGTIPIFDYNTEWGLIFTEVDVLRKGRTICLMTLTFGEMWIALESRTLKSGVIKGRFSLGLYLFLAWSIGLLILFVTTPTSLLYVQLMRPAWQDWVISLASSLVIPIFSGLYKWIIRTWKFSVVDYKIMIKKRA